MTDSPILFNTEMVRAILDGRKTQTRRVVKPQPIGVGPIHGMPVWKDKQYKIKYSVGDLLWVRETFMEHHGESKVWYKADQSEQSIATLVQFGGKWRPSIFMPRWASRITLRVTAVKVERVQGIRDSGAMSEGIICDGSKDFTGITTGEPVVMFAKLWDSINAKRGYSWQSNPWVWVVEFERVTP